MEIGDLYIWGWDDAFNPLKGKTKQLSGKDEQSDCPKQWALEICENVLGPKGSMSHSEE